MTETHETVDLWGDIVTEAIRTPLTILKEQGALLERKTNGILTVDVSSTSYNDGSFVHDFSIKSAILNYSYKIFNVHHPIEIYPVRLTSEVWDNGQIFARVAENEEEFMNLVKEILRSKITQKVISTLLSQSSVA